MQVCVPESAALKAEVDTTADVWPLMKQSPEQVEDQIYSVGPTAPEPTSQVRVSGEAAEYSLLVELMDTETLPTEETEKVISCIYH